MKQTQVTKRQHTVPVFFLRAFTVGGQGKQLVAYDKHDSSSRTISISDASVVNHCYSFRDSDGEWNDAAERSFSEIESHAAELVEGLRTHAGDGFSNEDRYDFALFAVLQMRRSHALSANFQSEIQRGLDDPQALLKSLEMNLPKLRTRYSDAEIEDCKQRIRAGELAGTDPNGEAKKAAMRSLLEHLPRSASVLEGMSWQVLKAKAGCYFVCSDMPAYVRRPEDDSDLGVLGLNRGDLNAHFYLPLSPKYFLIAGHRPIPRQCQASKTRVADLNRRTIRMAGRWVFSHVESEPIRALVRAG